MIVINEQKHKLNINNFFVIIDKIGDIKTVYKPSNTRIGIENLEQTKSSLEINNLLYDEIKNRFMDVFNTRIEIFSLLTHKLTIIKNHLKTLTIHKENKNEIYSIIKPILLKRKLKQINIDTIESDELFELQINFCNLIKDFTKLLNILSSHSSYNPDDPEIMTVNLKLYLYELLIINNLCKLSLESLIEIRKERNKILYFKENNALELIRDVKDYLKSIDNKAITEDLMISKMKFKSYHINNRKKINLKNI